MPFKRHKQLAWHQCHVSVLCCKPEQCYRSWYILSIKVAQNCLSSKTEVIWLTWKMTNHRPFLTQDYLLYSSLSSLHRPLYWLLKIGFWKYFFPVVISFFWKAHLVTSCFPFWNLAYGSADSQTDSTLKDTKSCGQKSVQKISNWRSFWDWD